MFAEKNGTQSPAQITAFEDTWHWDMSAARAYEELVTSGPGKLADLIQALQGFLGTNDMMAYLTMMAVRLVEMHRVLKETGSLYLHCDPVASHYLKIILDSIFGVNNFRNEVIWRSAGSHNIKRSFGNIHQTILFYTKSNEYTFNIVRRPYALEHVKKRYKIGPSGKLEFSSGGNVLTGKGVTEGDSCKPWRGFDPKSKGRHWAVPSHYEDLMPTEYKFLKTTEKLEALYQADFVRIEEGKAWPVMVRYLDERAGIPISDIWAYQPYTEGTLFGTSEGIDADVAWLGPTDPDRLGYETQKPDGLLRRIIRVSSKRGDLVLDPFCGCGTTIAAAELLQRRWIGIDITHLSITLMVKRLEDTFGDNLSYYEIQGDPKDLQSAVALANKSRHQFEWWALSLVDARPAQEKKMGADTGIDGFINFFDDKSGKAKKIIVQVKSGHVSVHYIRDLKGVLEREKAPIGALVTLEKPTGPMRKEAATAGFYEPEHFPGKKYPRLQILTVEELLAEKVLEYPRVAPAATFKKAKRQIKAKEGPMHPETMFDNGLLGDNPEEQ